ncbi:MAG: IS66 family insertion sequence element accessory protein TnpB [Eubacteriales bacterium]
MLGDISGIAKIFIVTGRTDMRRSIDGLMAIIRDTYDMDPYGNAIYLFCGKRRNTIKALYFDKDGFCLVYKRLDSNGRFQWPKDASEVRALSRQEFRWLLEGLSIDQPKAIRPTAKNKKKVF